MKVTKENEIIVKNQQEGIMCEFVRFQKIIFTLNRDHIFVPPVLFQNPWILFLQLI